jgi:PTS system mannitol-specific IIC component
MASYSQRIQRFGRFLSGMVMPNIGAFIAWGLITALFIPTGWLPNEKLATVVGPMIIYLLPLLIGYTGGKMVADVRGGVLGAIATMGIIIGTTIPMFIGGMIMGPLAGWCIKKTDQLFEDKIPLGFEMLFSNFSAGIVGAFLSLLAFIGVGTIVERLSQGLGSAVEAVVQANALPLASVFIEPAKVLFLNNAINHGVLGPLGIDEAAEFGQSIFFLLETNPGPGLGILCAYFVFSKGMIKQSAPGAMIIHFLGGIHEIYFPYILMQPKLILAVIAGGASGVLTFVITGTGLVATPSPGSVVALLVMAPRGETLLVLLGIIISAVVTFLVASVLIDRKEQEVEYRLNHAQEKMQELKGKPSSVVQSMNIDRLPNDREGLKYVRKIVVACDAGMGSSAMGASKLRTAFKQEHIDIEVLNRPIEQIPDDTDLVITHKTLTERAKITRPDMIHLSISDFIITPLYEKLVQALRKENGSISEPSEDMNTQNEKETLQKQNIKLGLPSVSKEEAIRMAGQILYEEGYVESEYIDAMVQRDSELSTYIGNGTAIPHGVSEAKKNIKRTGISVLQFPEGVDFAGNPVYLVVGIAGVGNEHLMILSNLAEIVEDEDKVELLRRTNDVDYVYKQFTNQAF